MRHLLISMSMYGPDAPVGWNALRLGMVESTSAPSIRAQTSRDFEWLVAVHPDDPLLDRRVAAFESAGVDCRFVFFDPARQKRGGEPEGRVNPRLEASAVMNWWEVQWRFDQVLHPVLGGLSEPLLLTRLDDDDAFAATAMQRVQAAAAGNPDPEPVVWTFPQGLLVWHTPPVPVEIQRFWHPLIGFSTFQVPAGSRLHPYSYGHNQVHHYLPVRVVDEEVGWALFRHDDNMSLLSRREARQAGRVEGTGGAAGIEMVFGETVSLPEALRGGLLDGFPLDWGRWQ